MRFKFEIIIFVRTMDMKQSCKTLLFNDLFLSTDILESFKLINT